MLLWLWWLHDFCDNHSNQLDPTDAYKSWRPTSTDQHSFQVPPETSVHRGQPHSEPWSKNPMNLQEREFCKVCSQTRAGPKWKSITGSYLKSPILVSSTAHLKIICGQGEMTKQIGKCYELDECGNTTQQNLWKHHKQWLKDFRAAANPYKERRRALNQYFMLSPS